MIAKFPSPTDDWPVPRWEAVAMDLARAAGINVPPARLLTVLKRPIFVMGRFDRDEKGRRIPFISALTALGAADGDTRSYIELLDLIRQDGALPETDAQEIWRRMVFNLLISTPHNHFPTHVNLPHPPGRPLPPPPD